MNRLWRYSTDHELDRIATETPGVIEVSVGITTKQQLMRELFESVPLPDYFGHNWDALDECLRDRVTDDQRPTLCLLHRDLPLQENEHDCRDYLALLDDTLTWANGSANYDFEVVFPTRLAVKIERLLDGHESI